MRNIWKPLCCLLLVAVMLLSAPAAGMRAWAEETGEGTGETGEGTGETGEGTGETGEGTGETGEGTGETGEGTGETGEGTGETGEGTGETGEGTGETGEGTGETGEGTGETVPAKPALQSIGLYPEQVTVEPGSTEVLQAFLTPENAEPLIVDWSSSNSFIARARADAADNRKCSVTGYNPGVAWITCTMDGVTARTEVIVSGVVLEQTRTTMTVGSVQQISVLTYGNAVSVLAGNWLWTSSNPEVAEVDPLTGEVVALKEGRTTISLRAAGSSLYGDSCDVTVRLDENLTVRVTLREKTLDFAGLQSRFDEICYTATHQKLQYLTAMYLSSNQATLYEGWVSESKPGTVVDQNAYYYAKDYAKSGNRRLDNLSLVPKKGFSGTFTVTFAGRSAGDRDFIGYIVVTVPDDVSMSSHNMRSTDYFQMNRNEFINYCQRLTTRDLRYIVFELPDSRYGRLVYRRVNNNNNNNNSYYYSDGYYYYDDYYDDYYYNYDGYYYGDYYYDNGNRIYWSGNYFKSAVEKDTRFYPNSTPNLDDVYFIPSSGYYGTFNLVFSGADIDGNEFAGSIRITVGNSYGSSSYQSRQIDYTMASGTELQLNYQDFTSASNSATNSQLDYIQFTSLPSSGNRAALYEADNDLVRTYVSYYLNPRGSQEPIRGLHFTAATGYTGTVTLNYTGWSTWGNSFTGTVRITVTTGGAGNYDVEYTVQAGQTLRLNSTDFSRVSQSATGRELSNIRLNSLPSASQGVLYADGLAVRDTSATYSRTGSNQSLGNLSFTPAARFSGQVTIPYTGRAENNQSFSGRILINVRAAAAVENVGVINYYSAGVAAQLLLSDFTNASRSYLSGNASGIRFILPDPNQGRLCVNFVSPTQYTPVASGRTYSFSELDKLVFLPKADFRGTATVSYEVTGGSGGSFNGTVSIQVAPPAASSVFRDMGNYSWAVQAVDVLQNYGILTGTTSGTFNPGDLTRRCDYVLMLYRAFRFPDAGLYSFQDVAQDSYYAAAVAAAKALNVVTGDDRGRFRPNNTVTRQDAAVLLYRAARTIPDLTLQQGGISDLERFVDGYQVSDYAVGPLGSLVRMGVFNGDQGHLYPLAPLTRAEMAAIFYRAIT